MDNSNRNQFRVDVIAKEAISTCVQLESGPEEDDFKLPEPTETSHSPEESCMQNALENELAQAIRYLSPNLRVAMQIRYREEASTAQIAKMLGISESAAKSRLLRAKSQIRSHLEKNQCVRCGIDSRTLAIPMHSHGGKLNPPGHQKRKRIRFKENKTMSPPEQRCCQQPKTDE